METTFITQLPDGSILRSLVAPYLDYLNVPQKPEIFTVGSEIPNNVFTLSKLPSWIDQILVLNSDGHTFSLLQDSDYSINDNTITIIGVSLTNTDRIKISYTATVNQGVI